MAKTDTARDLQIEQAEIAGARKALGACKAAVAGIDEITAAWVRECCEDGTPPERIQGGALVLLVFKTGYITGIAEVQKRI